MGSLYFLAHRKFYLHLSLAILFIILMFWGIFLFLNSYTQHGEEFVMPDFYGLSLDDLKEEGLDKTFTFVVLDSVYDPRKEKGIIIQQDPQPYSRVKMHRKVYITIIAKMPEMTTMPDLVDLSHRQAFEVLESAGLCIGKLSYVPHFAENAVLEQLINEEVIAPGSLIEKGTCIELIIGDGYKRSNVKVPFVIGLKQTEAIKTLQRSTLNIGNEYFLDGRDTSHARVYKQEPSFNLDSLYTHGRPVDLWYRSDEGFDFSAYRKSLLPDSASPDTSMAKEVYEYIEDTD